MMTAARTGKIFRYVWRTLVWLLLALILLEALLQTAAWFVEGHSHRARPHWLTGHLRVLALGDSNTYGLYLQANESYPSQLEQLWNSKHPDLPIEMINLGYPGTNSFRLLANLPAILDTFEPDVVLLMIGFNDFWTPAETPATPGKPTLLDEVRVHSRVYKLFFMLRERFQGNTGIDSGERQMGAPEVSQFTAEEIAFIEKETGLDAAELQNPSAKTLQDPLLAQKTADALQKIQQQRQQHPPQKDILNTVKYGDRVFSLGIIDGSSAGNSKQMPENIKQMLNLLQQRKVHVILLDYPTSHGYYPAANRKINRVANETGVDFIHLTEVFPENCRSNPEHCPELLFFDAHATAAGNTLVAQKVMEGLEGYLQDGKR